MSSLQGKVAVVTGASKGIGAGIAKKLGAEGANVVVNYASDRAGAEAVVAEIKTSGGKAVAVQANISNQSDVKKLIAESVKAFGKLDILVNNAGIYDGKPLEQIDEEHIRRHFDLNVTGLLLTTREAVANMNGNGGSVINISSVASKTPAPGFAVYSATKGAVDVITRVLAQELGPRNIRVNTLSPGFTDTEGVRAGEHAGKNDLRDYLVSRTPLGRAGTPEDIANVAAFLASDESGWITGEDILAGGGVRV
jgi:3-oxoacyl-[acyl-carrier protein] reductase